MFYLFLFLLVPGIAAVISILAFGFDGAWIYALDAVKPGCQVPVERFPSAGAFVALDTRRTGESQRFTDRDPKAWAAEQAMALKDLAERTTPLVIYVHGFRTAQADAVCTGKVLRAELAGIAAAGAAPDVLVFGWPTELGLSFSKAQENAPRAAAYLSTVLDVVGARPVMLLAHSLGAAVAMETLRSGRRVRVAVLVQAAVPATSMLTWEYKIDTTFPAANRNEPLREKGTGRGCFVAAAMNADRMIVTTSSKDLTLDGMYSRDELFMPVGCPFPLVPPKLGRRAWSLPQYRAIGTPIQMKETVVFEQEMRKIEIDPDSQWRQWRQREVKTRLAPDPADILMKTDFEYHFENPHPDFRKIPLDTLPRAGGPLIDWHAPLAYPHLRQALLIRIWEEAGSDGSDQAQSPQ